MARKRSNIKQPKANINRLLYHHSPREGLARSSRKAADEANRKSKRHFPLCQVCRRRFSEASSTVQNGLGARCESCCSCRLLQDHTIRLAALQQHISRVSACSGNPTGDEG